jgi:hypothetical protein
MFCRKYEPYVALITSATRPDSTGATGTRSSKRSQVSGSGLRLFAVMVRRIGSPGNTRVRSNRRT